MTDTLRIPKEEYDKLHNPTRIVSRTALAAVVVIEYIQDISIDGEDTQRCHRVAILPHSDQGSTDMIAKTEWIEADDA